MVNRWWQRMVGWWCWLRRRPRLAHSPFEPPSRARPKDRVHDEIVGDTVLEPEHQSPPEP